MPRQIISGLEKGTRPRPEGETVQRLAGALGVTPRQLRGCDAIPELATADPGLADAGQPVAGGPPAAQEEPPEPPGGPEERPPADTAFGFTSLLRLPPGTVVEVEYRPDGSVALTLRVPNHLNPPANPPRPERPTD